MGVVQVGITSQSKDDRLSFVAKLCAFVATVIVILMPGYKPIKYGSTANFPFVPCTQEQNTDERPPIMKSKSRGFRPVYVYSHAKPPGSRSYSQVQQDTLILALMKATKASNTTEKNRNPFFVDLASNDAILLSNTFLLENHGWDGLCLEPNPQYWYRLASFRSCTIVGAFVGGTQEEDGKEIDVFLPSTARGVFGGIVGKGMDNMGAANEKRSLVSIATVFEETKVPGVIDYFSLDVEGAELLVMQNFPWDIYKFKFMTIERPTDDLIKLLHSHGYEMVMIISDWGETLWINKEHVFLSKELIVMIADRANVKHYDSWTNTISGVVTTGGFPA